jgi:RNA polymerase sigma-70 factor (ECF subfamily)
MAGEESDAGLVERARGGVSDAFRVLVERHSRSVFRLAYRMTLNEFDADDVVQETFLRAYRSLARFDGRAEFSTWIYRIAVNCSLDLQRAKGKRAEVGGNHDDEGDGLMATLATNDPAPDRVALSGQLRRIVDETLAGLSPMERTAFLMRHVEGLPVPQISAVLGRNDGATKHSIFRAVKKLREALRPVAGVRR